MEDFILKNFELAVFIKNVAFFIKYDASSSAWICLFCLNHSTIEVLKYYLVFFEQFFHFFDIERFVQKKNSSRFRNQSSGDYDS